jgi:iron complex outermembrane receptor protein
MAELFISTNQSGLEIYPNPQLQPESGWSSEVGIKQGLKTGKWMGYIDIAAFIMEYDDMMEFSFGQWAQNIFDPNTGEPTENLFGLGFKSVNVGKTRISGLELSLNGQGKINPDLTINIIAGYTYMNPISLDLDYEYAQEQSFFGPNDTIEGKMITYRSSSSDTTMLKYRYKHIAKADIEVIYKKISLGGSVRYNSFMKNIDLIFTDPLLESPVIGITGINEAREKFKNGDIIIDLRAGWQINEITRLGFIINNLLNTEYMSRPANMMPQRTFAMQLALKI